MIKNELNESISIGIIEKLHVSIRTVIKKYYCVVYQSEVLGEKNSHKYFSVDGSLINHKNNRQLWIIGSLIIL